MPIRILTSLATCPQNGPARSYEKGDEVTWPDKADAKRLIAAGYAESLEPAEPEPKAKK